MKVICVSKASWFCRNGAPEIVDDFLQSFPQAGAGERSLSEEITFHMAIKNIELFPHQLFDNCRPKDRLMSESHLLTPGNFKTVIGAHLSILALPHPKNIH